MKILRMLLLAFCIFFAVANANDAQKWASEITAGKQIPTGKFLAFYLNKDDSKNVVFSETVENINLNLLTTSFIRYLRKILSPTGLEISISNKTRSR